MAERTIAGSGRGRRAVPMVTPLTFGIQGHVSSGFERVRDAFVENFSRRRELGGACCAFYRGDRKSVV